MDQRVVDYTPEDAKTVIEAAFEQSTGIKKYGSYDTKVVGKTGMSLGSWGEEVTVSFAETDGGDMTRVIVGSDPKISINVTSRPEWYEKEFLDQFDALCGYEVEDIVDHINEHERDGQSSFTSETTAKSTSGIRNSSSTGRQRKPTPERHSSKAGKSVIKSILALIFLIIVSLILISSVPEPILLLPIALLIFIAIVLEVLL